MLQALMSTLFRFFCCKW